MSHARRQPSPPPEAAQRLQGLTGRAWWRTLEEVAETPEFRTWLERELPDGAELWPPGVDRRSFLRVMAASLALAGMGSCSRQPPEKIVPHVRPPEVGVPGRPLVYATSLGLGGFGTGVLVESHGNRPTKVEGNPLHPSSLGAAGAREQASVLGLYDPDRSQVITFRGRVATADGLRRALDPVMATERRAQGSGLRVLTREVTSPSLAFHLKRLLQAFPEARWHHWEPAGRDAARAAAHALYGTGVDAVYHPGRASVLLCLGGGLLSDAPGALRYARDLSQAWRGAAGPEERPRLYVVESTPSLVGARADHRLPLDAGRLEPFARALAARLGVPGVEAQDGTLPEAARRWLDPLARDIRAGGGDVLVAAGEHQPMEVHALALAINHHLGAVGRTVELVEPVAATTGLHGDSLRELVADMQAGRVRALVILEGNPVLDTPGDVPFREALEMVPTSVHLGLEEDETAVRCTWHVPRAHDLESWGDLRGHDGTVGLQQPLIAPLYGGWSSYELLGLLLGEEGTSPQEAVQTCWRERLGGEDAGPFEPAWRRALHDGVVPNTRSTAKSVTPRTPPPPPPGDPQPGGVEVLLHPHPALWDGRFANNAWLQELPDPFSKVAWDNPAWIAPALARRHGLEQGDVVRLEAGGASLELPVWIQPGQAPDTVTVHLGFGRRVVGRVGRGVGADAYPLQRGADSGRALRAVLRPTGGSVPLASTQGHHLMEGRGLVREVQAGEVLPEPGGGDRGHGEESAYPAWHNPGYAWGMSIDLDACIGCNACVVACQAENNIPVVGREQVLMGREMHWIRVDAYYSGEPGDPRTAFQPVPCMHCEKAPCEPVCPVGATVHSSEGLNEMVYNRCVGTRYCSNNCPYKVRRFNFFDYTDTAEAFKAGRNPDVTVRSRGVMEKCTYCVQRINRARIQARKEDRAIRDGEVVTACQAACPTRAIVFGDQSDPESAVARAKSGPTSYTLLEELGTRPRTTYRARVHNPNPELPE